MSKVWLVTGSASGLGRNIAEAVLASGDRLLATARDPCRLEDLVKKYGAQVDSEFATNLLVQQAGDHQGHHLLFAMRERSVTVLEELHLRFSAGATRLRSRACRMAASSTLSLSGLVMNSTAPA